MPAHSAPREPRFSVFWAWPCLLAATLACYWPALNGGIVWDDQAHVTRPDLRTLDGLRRIWFELGATQQYYPVIHSAFWVEHRLWGDHTLGYHLLNAVLHATSALLLVVLLRRLWSGRAAATAGACYAGLLFAVHPVYVESVAWISEQKNTLSTVFYLSSALLYLKFAESPGRRPRRWYAFALALFILALLSKSVTATLPAALLVVLWWRQGALRWRRDIAPLIPWFAVGAASGLFTAWVERRYIGAEGEDFTLTFVQRCLLAGRDIWFYLGKLIWPVHLMFIYPRWSPERAGLGWAIYLLGALAVTAVLVWRAGTHARGLLAGWLFFVGSLFPALGFFNVYPFIFSYVADHFQYLASMGVVSLAAAGWAWWVARARRSAAPYASAALIAGALGTLSFLQSRMYGGDIVTLYQDTIARNPNCWMAHYNLGIIEGQHGRLDQALANFDETLRIKPNFYPALVNSGDIRLQGGDPLAAVELYEAALRFKPDAVEANTNLGEVLTKLGRPDEATLHLQTAIRADPYFAPAHFNLGNAERVMGRRAEAIAEYRLALKIDPSYAPDAMNLGNLLLQTGDLPGAIGAYRQALEAKPDYAQAHANLARALIRAGRYAEAQSEFEAAASLSAAAASAH